jgi:hypothetical protein
MKLTVVVLGLGFISAVDAHGTITGIVANGI